VNGRKRHIAVDAADLLLAVVITAASVQDRDAARPLLRNLHRSRENIFSDTQPPPPRRNKPRQNVAEAIYLAMLVSTSTQLKCISVGSFARTTGTLSRRTLPMPGPDCWARTMAG
jgi:hypothetical protein